MVSFAPFRFQQDTSNFGPAISCQYNRPTLNPLFPDAGISSPSISISTACALPSTAAHIHAVCPVWHFSVWIGPMGKRSLIAAVLPVALPSSTPFHRP
jgi:hypothetical protein